ncbi:MAG: sensor histidine kinase [Rhizomicrobium sp.]
MKHSRAKTQWFRLEHKLRRQGGVAATTFFAALAVMMAFLVHLILSFVGAKLTLAAFFHIAIETLAVAVPLILYSRQVIAQLDRSRRQLKEMSRRLAIAVDEAEQASRAKSAFLASMSHELRTPLNAILGFSEVMKEESLGPLDNPRYRAYVTHIHDSGKHLLGIINDVLDLAKIEAGKMSLDRAAEFELAPAISAALAMLKSLSEKFAVTLNEEIAGDRVTLIGMERMIRQIVINLVGNAIKFTPPGGMVTLTGRPKGDGSYDVTVRDTGVGMNPSEMALALIPFGQNGNRLSSRHDGTGLGLPLAKAMVELHGGSFKIESAPEHGTVVTMTFPPARVRLGRAAA